MTVQLLGGAGYLVGDKRYDTGTVGATSNKAIGALNDQVAMLGIADYAGTGPKNITKVHVGVQSQVVGTFTFRASVQGIKGSTGDTVPPGIPDGTIKGATNNALFSNAYVASGPGTGWQKFLLNEVAAVNKGDELSLVFEMTAWTSGSVTFQFAKQTNDYVDLNSSFVTFNSAVQALYCANVILEFDDGTFGTLSGAIIFDIYTSTSFNNTTVPPIRALKFIPKTPCKLDAIDFLCRMNVAGDDADIVLYDGTTVLATAHLIRKHVQQINVASGWHRGIFNAPVLLTAGHTYYAALKPLSANNIQLYEYTVNDDNHLPLMSGESTWIMSTLSGGVWTDIDKRRMIAVLRFCAFDDGLSAGGGALIGAGGLIG